MRFTGFGHVDEKRKAFLRKKQAIHFLSKTTDDDHFCLKYIKVILFVWCLVCSKMHHHQDQTQEISGGNLPEVSFFSKETASAREGPGAPPLVPPGVQKIGCCGVRPPAVFFSRDITVRGVFAGASCGTSPKKGSAGGWKLRSKCW